MSSFTLIVGWPIHTQPPDIEHPASLVLFLLIPATHYRSPITPPRPAKFEPEAFQIDGEGGLMAGRGGLAKCELESSAMWINLERGKLMVD